MDEFRGEIIEASKKHLLSCVHRHRMNIEVLLWKGVGVAEHPDIMETIEKELELMADYNDKLEMLDKYFGE